MLPGFTGYFLYGGLTVSRDRAFHDEMFFDYPVRWCGLPEFFYPGHFIPAPEEWAVVDFTQEPGNCRSVCFGKLKMRTDILNSDPLF